MSMDTEETSTKYGKVSFKNGYWFHFEDGDDDITVHASALTGKEWVYINDKLVSEKLGLTLKTIHSFNHEGADYTVCFGVVKLLTGKVKCTVTKNDERIGEKTISFSDGTPKEVRKRVLPVLIVTFAIGFVAGVGGIRFGKRMALEGSGFISPTEFFVAGVVLVSAIGVWHYYRKKS